MAEPQTVLRQRLLVPGETVKKVADAMNMGVGDPLPTTKGAPMGVQFSEWGAAFIWAPYHMTPFRWPPFLITLFICFLLATIMGTAVPNVASYVTSTSVGDNAEVVAIITFVVLLLGMSFRHADHLPQFMHPALVFAEWFHGHIGLVVAIPMMGCMLGGAALRSAGFFRRFL